MLVWEATMLNTYHKSLYFIKNIFLSLRPQSSLPAAFLVHVGSRLNNQRTNWLLVFIMFAITALIMLQNDYFDSEHDFFKKNKRFVYENKKIIFYILIFSWPMIFLVTFLFTLKIQLFLLVISIVGFFYSFLRKIFLLPLLTIAVLSGLPIILQGNISQTTILFISVTIITILGREILKDIEDKDVDFGYKKTLATETSFSIRSLHRFVVFLLLTSLAIFTFFILRATRTEQALSLIPVVFIFMAIYKLLKTDKSATIAKKYFDFAIFTIIIILSF